MANGMVSGPTTLHDLKNQVHDPDMLRARYLENSWLNEESIGTKMNDVIYYLLFSNNR